MIAFISGGARSGKSSFAENFALELFKKKRLLDESTSLFYIATAIGADSEMVKRIEHHIQDRSFLWNTIESPFEQITVFEKFKKGTVVLLDCLTLGVSNQLYERKMPPKQIEDHLSNLIELVKQKQVDFIIVSNDLNEGLPIKNSLVCQYIHTLERLHMEIIHHADIAIQVIAGIPLHWKGEIK